MFDDVSAKISKIIVPSGLVIAHLDDGIICVGLLPFVGIFCSEAMPSNKSTISYTSSPVLFVVEI